MRKRLLTSLLALCVALTLMPGFALAAGIVASGECGADGDNVTWTLDTDGVLDISGNGVIENDMLGGPGQPSPWLYNGYDNLVKNVVIHSGVTSIEWYAFYECINLASVTLPTSIKDISMSVFEGCSKLSDVYYSGTKAQWEQIDIDNVLDGNAPLLNATTHCSDGTILSKGFVPSENRCGNNLTWKLDNDKTFTIQGTGEMWDFDITAPSPWWEESDSVKRIVVKEGVTSIGREAFGEYLGNYGSYNNWTNMVNVTIPKSITDIHLFAFDGCKGLKDIYYAGTEAQWKQVDIHDDLYMDGNSPLLNATIHYNSVAINSEPAVPTSTPTTMGTGFTDVAANAYYAIPISWAVEQGITNGTSANQFSPNETCTNAQILTFLWRAYGESEPTIRNPFPDDIPLAFAKAAIWAYENKMISVDTFDVNIPCTRAMAVTYMWLAAGSPTNVVPSSFTDVPPSANYAQAVAWAVANNITNGTSANQFSPNATCTRAQIVTFLYRLLAA